MSDGLCGKWALNIYQIETKANPGPSPISACSFSKLINIGKKNGWFFFFFNQKKIKWLV